MHNHSNTHTRTQCQIANVSIQKDKDIAIDIPEMHSLDKINVKALPQPKRVFCYDKVSYLDKLAKQNYMAVNIYTVVKTPAKDWLGYFQDEHWRLYPLPTFTKPNDVILIGGELKRGKKALGLKFPNTGIIKLHDDNNYRMKGGLYVVVDTGGIFMHSTEAHGHTIHSVLAKS